MSIIKVNKGDFETISIQAQPGRTYSSSSLGITGSVNLFARKSSFNKEVAPVWSLNQFDDNSLLDSEKRLQTAASNNSGLAGAASAYLDKVNETATAKKQNINVDVIRFEPSFDYTADTARKLTIINRLYPDNKIKSDNYDFSFTNYNCLNFFTASSIPSSAALIYPNSASQPSATKASGSYAIDNAFTFEFNIKPKNFLKRDTDEYTPGGILHLSSSYALTLVTGSSVDQNGIADKFRIKLQLSHSAGIHPDEATPGAYPNDLIFMSNDNSLTHNAWHHVAVKWSAAHDGQVGNFYVDGASAGSFILPSSSIGPAPFTISGNPDALIVGNYYAGMNTGDNKLSRFFTDRVSRRDGLVKLSDHVSDGPTVPDLNYPLSAELHEIRIFNTARKDSDIAKYRTQGIKRDTPGLAFYLPPFFTREAPQLQQIGEVGGVLQTPFFGISGSTTDPFNIGMSFGVGGHYVNLENFTRDFKTLNFPRLFDLTGSQITTTSETLSCNEFLYGTGSNRYRNLFILPCDNGNFSPGFFNINLVETGSIKSGALVVSSSNFYKYRNDYNTADLSKINLRDLLPDSSYVQFVINVEATDENGNVIPDVYTRAGNGFENEIMGASPEDMGIDPGQILTIFQRTRDDTSNEIVMFDISNLFYGHRIKPGSFQITDSALTGSSGLIGMTLKDDAYGNLYRADSSTPHCTWNSVGNIFYDEGIIMIKTPCIPMFGKDQFEVSFKGEQEIHVMKVDIVAPSGMINSSSNPNYLVTSASLDANDQNMPFVSITGINFHDDNLNVIMRTQFAQPVIKRDSDKILFRTKLDF